MKKLLVTLLLIAPCAMCACSAPNDGPIWRCPRIQLPSSIPTSSANNSAPASPVVGTASSSAAPATPAKTK